MTTLADFALSFVGIKQGTRRHKNIVNTYNQLKPLPRGYKVKYSDSWYMIFVSYCELAANVKKPIYECSCFYALKKAKELKQTVPKNKAQINDLIFYDCKNSGTVDHVGIITEITDKYFKVVESNYSKQVKVIMILKTDKQIKAIVNV